MRNIRGLLLLVDCIVNWHVSIAISLEVPLSLKLLVYWREFLFKICLKMKDVKENSVQWHTGTVIVNGLKFDKVGKH